MHRLILVAMALMLLTGCGQKATGGATERDAEREDDVENAEQTVEAVAEGNVPLDSAKNVQRSTFNVQRYQDGILEYAFPMRFAKSAEPVRIVEYALIDIDGDGQDELWVRGDEGQDFQAVFALAGDSVMLLADADVRSEILLYKNAVGYDGYYGDGRVMTGATVVKNSRPAESYFEDYTFNIFSEEQEMLEESYYVNDKSVEADECAKFKERLGDTIAIPQLEWHAINPIMQPEED